MSEGPVYDALLIVGFGGPEGPDDVLPFLENVTRGREIPPDRLREVGAHYALFGGVSPINAQNRGLVAAVQAELGARGVAMPVYWGNRHWHPFLEDTLRAMATDGVQRSLAFVTSAFGSYSGCRQYLDAIERARAQVGPGAPIVDKIRLYYNHAGFLEPLARNVRTAMSTPRPGSSGPVRLVFTAHSVPAAALVGSPYLDQLHEACRLIAAMTGVADDGWDLVFQSRSGPPSVPWLEPDVNEHLRSLRARGVEDVVVVPVGFTSDHMEVIYDLDTQARKTATDIGLGWTRVPTVGVDPAFVAMIAELVGERSNSATPRRSLGTSGPSPDVCSGSCCPGPIRAR